MTEKIMERAILTCEVKEADGSNVLVFDGSTEDIDRMEEVISADGWQLANYKKNPVFLWAHNYNMPPIGRSLRTWVDKATKRLKFKIEFANAETYPFADTIYQLYKGGFMNAVSVGFIPLETEERKDDDKSGEHDYRADSKGKKDKEPRRRYVRQELLELSAAPVPANPEALQNAVTAGIISDKDVAELEQVVTLNQIEVATKRMKDAADEITNIWADGATLFGDPVAANRTDIAMDNDTGDYHLEWIDNDPVDLIEAKAKYNCECIDCGHKLTSDKHCKDIKCPKCGGEMRREERPAGGRGIDEVVTKPEENDEYIRIPAKGEEGKHKDHKIRWIEVSRKEGIKGIYCIDCKLIITFVFLKDHGWTMAKAKKWMEEHDKAITTETVQGLWNTHERAVISQAALADEIEYLITELDSAGISEDASQPAWELVRTVLRLTGGDMPDDIADVTKKSPEPPLDIGREATGTIIEAVRDGFKGIFDLHK